MFLALARAYRIQIAISKQTSTTGDDAPLGGEALSSSASLDGSIFGGGAGTSLVVGRHVDGFHRLRLGGDVEKLQ
jgi:hypothetical protein